MSTAAAQEPRKAGDPTTAADRPPRISVLLPVRDAETHLSEAICSLAAQTTRDLEVIAVDDGSADASGDLLERWRREDPRVQVVHTPPLGLVPALETARARARGPFLARMDADDLCAPERFERQLALLDAHPGLAGCGCLVRYFPPDRVRDGARRYERWINRLVTPDQIERDFFVECPLAHPSFFLRAAAVAEVGGYRDHGWPEDYDLLLRLREAGGRFAKVPEPLLGWREGPDRLSRTAPAYAPAAFRRLKAHFLARGMAPRREGVVVWGAGPTGKAFARALTDEGLRLRAFVDLDPRKLGQDVHGVSVVAPDAAGSFRDALHVGAVGQAGAREGIREAFSRLGLREGEACVVVA